MKNIAGSEEEAKMSENEYKELNSIYLDTIKELNRIIKEQAKSDICYKYITISVIAIALFVTIAICSIGQSNQYENTLKIKCFSDTTKVQILKEE
jgi:hypothetical protein